MVGRKFSVSKANAQIDQVIIDAATGNALTGHTGATSTALPAAQQVAVDFGATASIGLTVEKLIEMKRLFQVNNVMRLGILENIVVRRNGELIEVVAGRQRVKWARVANMRLAKKGEPRFEFPA